MNNTRKRDMAIDGMRGVMIMLIVLLHSCQLGINHETGTIANIFFFMISGYLMYESKCLYGSVKDSSLFSFMYNRLKNIYPVFLVSLLTLIVIDGFRPVSEFLMNIALVYSGWFVDDKAINGPTWFFSVITFAYILFYTVCKYSKKEHCKYVVCGLTIVSYIFSTFNLRFPFLYGRTTVGIASFFAGCMLREIVDSLGEKKYFAGLSATIIAGFIWVNFFINGHEAAVGKGLFGFIFVLIPMTISSVTCTKYLCRIFSFAPLAYIGEKSMYLFIWHLPVIHLCNRIGLNELRGICGTWIYEMVYLGILFIVIFAWYKFEKVVRMIISSKINLKKE